MNQQTMLHPEQLKDKNLVFFSKHFPEVYNLCTTRTFERLTLNIDHKGKIDLLDGNKGLYNGDAVAYSKEEAQQFLSDYQPGNNIHTIAPPRRGKISFHRFFSKRLNALVNSAPFNTNLINNTYQLPDFYPMVVFLGSGLGIHISEVINQQTILNVLIFEPDNEKFMASLYITDWSERLLPVINNGCSVKILVGFNYDLNTEEVSAHLWNELIQYTPSFPLMSLFYNHQQNSAFLPVIEKIKKDLHFYLNQWGYYDDEVNQMNNALHNIFSGIPQLKSQENKLSGPVAIIGGGPSLDDRIDTLRKHQNKLTIISCGTAVHTLLKEGITPDIHVEIESHMLTYESLSKSENHDFFEKTLLIGALQLPPNVFQLFKNKAYFIKESTALAELFSEPGEIIHRATPTCTNSGLAIATHLQASEVYLFGMDFGFHKIENHHSKSSIYYTDKISEEIQKEIAQTYINIQQTEGVDGGKVFTIPMYNTSRRAIEFCIKSRSQLYPLMVYNCSDGANVEFTQHIGNEIFHNKINKINSTKENLLIRPIKVEPNEIREKINITYSYLKTTCRELMVYTRMLQCDSLESLFRTCHLISRHINNRHRSQYGALYYLTRGSLWHFMNAGTSIALSLQDSQERKVYIEEWKESLESYFRDLPEHFNKVTSKSYPDPNDPWIREDIVGKEHLYDE